MAATESRAKKTERILAKQNNGGGADFKTGSSAVRVGGQLQLVFPLITSFPFIQGYNEFMRLFMTLKCYKK